MFLYKNAPHKSSILKILTLFVIIFLVFGCSVDAGDLEAITETSKSATSILEVSSLKSKTTFSQTGNSVYYSKSVKAGLETILGRIPDQKSANSEILTSLGSKTSDLSNSKLLADLKIHYIDVGQGDGIFIELPNNQTILIDAGDEANGDQIVNYIKGLGYDFIDYAIATHPHADHIGGMTAVINQLSIGKFYMPDIDHSTITFESMIDALIANNIDVYRAQAGVDIVNINGLQTRFLSPMDDYGSNSNNWSAVVKINFGQNAFLFMGDAESQVENMLSDVKADVLKVGHHGASSSSGMDFLKEVNPKYAIISVGANNSYGYPAEDTIKNLTALGCEIHRTDLSGTIIVTSNGFDININKNSDSGFLLPLTLKKTESKESSSNITSNTTKQTINQTIKQTIPSPANTTTAPTIPIPAQTTTAPIEEEIGYTVYITNTGTKYHRGHCRHLSKSKVEISKSDARAQGYEPCKVCNP